MLVFPAHLPDCSGETGGDVHPHSACKKFILVHACLFLRVNTSELLTLSSPAGNLQSEQINREPSRQRRTDN